MFCNTCGAENQASAKFCKRCGKPLVRVTPLGNEQYRQSPQQAQAPRPTPVMPQATAMPRPQTAAPASTPAGTLKKVASSPVFLAAIITATLAILYNVVFNVLLHGSNLEWTIRKIIAELPSQGLPAELDEFVWMVLDGMNRISASVKIITMAVLNLPGILVLVGLWITIISAVQRKRNTITTGGLTLIKVIIFIGLVFGCVLLALSIIAMAVVCFALSVEVETRLGIMLGVCSAIVLLVSYGIYIAYMALINKSLNIAREVAKNNVPNYRASMFVAVMLFIGALCSVPGILFSGVSGVLTIISRICFGITIIQYRNKMRNVPAPATATGAYNYPVQNYQPTMPVQNYVSVRNPVPVAVPVVEKTEIAEPITEKTVVTEAETPSPKPVETETEEIKTEEE